MTLSNLRTTIPNIATSLVGSTLLYSAQENIAEYAGYYAGAIAGSHLLNRIAGAAFKCLGSLTALGAAGGVATGAAALGSYAATRFGGVNPDLATSIKPFFITLVTMALFYLLNSSFVSADEMAGQAIGNFLDYFMGAFLGGFLAISFCGSEEKIWDPKDLWNTYIIKSLQCLLLFVVIDHYRSSEGGVGRAIFDQILGSLAYNALAIGRGALIVAKRELLSDVLPERPSVAVIVKHPQLAHSSIHQFYKKMIDIPWVQQAVKMSLSGQAYRKLYRQCEKMTQELFKDFATQALVEHMKTKLVDYLMITGGDALASTEIVKKFRTQLIHMSSDELIFRVIYAINQYSDLLRSPAIQQAQTAFEIAYRNWQKEPEQSRKQELYNPYLLAKNILQSVLTRELTPSIPFLNSIDQNYQALASHPHLQFQEKEKQFLQEFYQATAQDLVQVIQKLEIKVLGFNLTGDYSSAFMQEMLEVYFRTMVQFLVVSTVSQFMSPSSEDMRSFYKNMASVFCSHYETVGVPLMNGIKVFAHDQIDHAQLAQVTSPF